MTCNPDNIPLRAVRVPEIIYQSAENVSEMWLHFLVVDIVFGCEIKCQHNFIELTYTCSYRSFLLSCIDIKVCKFYESHEFKL